MLSRIAAFVVWALAAAAAVYWGLKLFVRAPSAPATVAVAAAAPPQADWSRLFGRDAAPPAEAAAPEPAADARFQLVGVVAPRGSGSVGVALIGVDGKPPRAYKPGATIDGALVLQGIRGREVTLGPAGGAPQVRLELPPLPVAATGTLPPPVSGAVPQPPPAMPLPGTAPPTFGAGAAPRIAPFAQRPPPPVPAAPVNPGAPLQPGQQAPLGPAVQPQFPQAQPALPMQPQAVPPQFPPTQSMPAEPQPAASAAHRRRLTTM